MQGWDMSLHTRGGRWGWDLARLARTDSNVQLCSTLQYVTVQYSTVQYFIVMYSKIQYSSVPTLYFKRYLHLRPVSWPKAGPFHRTVWPAVLSRFQYRLQVQFQLSLAEQCLASTRLVPIGQAENEAIRTDGRWEGLSCPWWQRRGEKPDN